MCARGSMYEYSKRYMDASIEFIKVGNHWYPNIAHKDPSYLRLDPRLERKLDSLNEFDFNAITIFLSEISSIMPDNGVLQFLDNDILRYMTTDDEFDLTMFIDDIEYSISSKLYTLLENTFHLDLCKTLYRIYI